MFLCMRDIICFQRGWNIFQCGRFTKCVFSFAYLFKAIIQIANVLLPIADEIKVGHELRVIWDAADHSRERHASHPLSTGQSNRAPHSAHEAS